VIDALARRSSYLESPRFKKGLAEALLAEEEVVQRRPKQILAI